MSLSNGLNTRVSKERMEQLYGQRFKRFFAALDNANGVNINIITVPTLKRDENGCVQGLSVAVGNGDTLQTSTHSVVFTIGRKNDGQMDYLVETVTVNTEGEDCNSTRYSTSKDAQRGLFDALSGLVNENSTNTKAANKAIKKIETTFRGDKARPGKMRHKRFTA